MLRKKYYYKEEKNMTMRERLRRETERTYTPWEIANEDDLELSWYQEDDERFVCWYRDGMEVGPDYA